jgi:tetratricopeptide (TPR) repeat protein
LVLGVLAAVLIPVGSCPADSGEKLEAGAAPKKQMEFQIVPAAPVEKNPGYYDALADNALQQHDWLLACEIYGQALAAFPQHPRLKNNAAAVRDLWANAAMEKQQWEQALDACENALQQKLQADHFRKKITYIIQTGGRAYLRENDLVGLEAWLAQARSRFSGFPGLGALAPALYTEALAALPASDDCFYISQGVALILSYQNYRQAPQPDAGLVKDWCNRFLYELQEHKAWERALHLLQAARELRPDDAPLREREVALWNRLAQESIRSRQWEVATLIYEQALDRFPQEALFLNNLKYCRKMRGQAATMLE